MPDPRFGEELMAWIVTRGGAELDREAVAEFCKGKIAHYKVPRYVQVVSEFPMTVTGKVQKYKLREQAIEELRAGVEGRRPRVAAVCGRYTLSTVDGPDLAQRFGLIKPPDEETLGRFNVCPTETVAAVLEPGEAAAVPWGLRPFRNQNFAPINVRSETAGTRFKRLMDGGRCLVLADGWYEWLKQERKGAPRLPFRYTVDGGVPFAFAGVYDGTGVAILTTEANEIARPVHDRMPVVLRGPGGRGGLAERGRRRRRRRSSSSSRWSPARVSVAPANPGCQ